MLQIGIYQNSNLKEFTSLFGQFVTAELKRTLALCITVENLGRPSSNNMSVKCSYLFTYLDLLAADSK